MNNIRSFRDMALRMSLTGDPGISFHHSGRFSSIIWTVVTSGSGTDSGSGTGSGTDSGTGTVSGNHAAGRSQRKRTVQTISTLATIFIKSLLLLVFSIFIS